MGIQRDLGIGKIAENRVQEILESIGMKCTEVDKINRVLWDISFHLFGNSEKTHTIEVKNDVYALRSGNIAVEMFNPKSAKPSGLSATKADLWVFMVGAEIWITRTDTLRKFVEDNKPFRIIDSGGDNNAYLYLYKKDAILDTIFHRLDNLEKKELKDKINELIS